MKRPELVQFGDLRPSHFDRYPVWVDCHIMDYDEPWYDETDEETCRPWTRQLPADASEASFLVRAVITLADGSQVRGFLTPTAESRPRDASAGWPLGYVQPQLFLPPEGESARFWWGGKRPSVEERADFYRAIGKRPDQVFPARYAAESGLATGIQSGELHGFYSIPDGDAVIVER